MAKEKYTASPICLELALLTLQRAISGIQLIEECDINPADFRAHLPAVLDEFKEREIFLARGERWSPINGNVLRQLTVNSAGLLLAN